MLELVDVSINLGGRPVLADLSLTVQPGCSLAVTGPSGEGKTTLLNVIAGSLRPDRGLVRRSFDRSEVCYLLQNNDGLTARTALDNVALPLFRMMTASTARNTARAALDRVGLEDRASQPLKTMSGGEQQRIAIARAIAMRAKLILADEPTGHLDGANTDIVVTSLLRAVAEDSSVVIVTHDPAVATRCDEVLRLRLGRLEPLPEAAAGVTDALRDR